MSIHSNQLTIPRLKEAPKRGGLPKHPGLFSLVYSIGSIQSVGALVYPMFECASGHVCRTLVSPMQCSTTSMDCLMQPTRFLFYRFWLLVISLHLPPMYLWLETTHPADNRKISGAAPGGAT